jgi:long-subunit fatty acid transport protein
MSRSFQTESILVPAAPFYWRPVNVATNFYFYPTDNHLQLTQELFGLSGGKAITDSFSLGASIVAERQRYQGHTTLFLPHFQEAQLAFLQPLFGQALAEIAVNGDDWQPALFLGALWTPNEAFQLGLSLQHHGRFSYDYTVSERTLDVTTVTLGPYEEIQAGTASFSMPDHLSLGFRYRIGEAFMVAGELAMSRTSELTRSMVYFFNQQGNELKAKDTLELRMGAEYTWFQWSYPFSIRAGYRFEPYHAATNTLQDEELLFRDDQGNQGVRNSVFLNRFEQDLNHVSCGMGWILSRQWQVDMAGVWSETGADYALSMLYRY